MTMTNAHTEGRVVRDADSHIVEPPGWIENYASKYVIDNLGSAVIPFDHPQLAPVIERAASRVAGELEELTADMKTNLFGHKEKYTMWGALGAYDTAERVETLDIAGLSSQLVFPGVCLSMVAMSSDERVQYEGSDALNRGMAEFCSDDRLLAVGWLPMGNPEETLKSAERGIAAGVSAFQVPTDAVNGRSPAHIDFDPVWAVLEEARVPVLLHIGSGRRFPNVYMETGVPRTFTESFSNIETTKPHDVPVLHHSTERWLTSMIYFGVLDRFPNLKIGIVELGSNWIPASMMNMDMGISLLGKFDKGLQDLSLKPSEFMRRQVRVAPLHTEDTGWVLRNTAPEMLMFNTDYPHPEGGRDPFGDFERSLDAVDATAEELDRFYATNFEELMGIKA